MDNIIFALKTYHPQTALVLNRNLDTEKFVEDTQVKFISCPNWLHALDKVFS